MTRRWPNRPETCFHGHYEVVQQDDNLWVGRCVMCGMETAPGRTPVIAFDILFRAVHRSRNPDDISTPVKTIRISKRRLHANR